jgi:sugar lactone lactonase YvrE
MIKALVGLTAIMALGMAAAAAGPAVWSVSSRADVLKGDSHGVSIDDNGTIILAPRLTRVFNTDQPYIWSSIVDGAGNVYMGTGGDGKIFRVTPSGSGSQFSDLAEMNVTALALGPGGELFAGTSPDGKVYRIDASGTPSVYFDPKEKYIWALALIRGGLAVGTGDGGRIYKVASANAPRESSLLFDTSEIHIISLATDKQGDLIAGSDAGGIVFRFDPQGKPFGLLDSPLREVHTLSVGPDGSIYALVLGDSASVKTPDAAATPTPESRTLSVPKPSAAPEPSPKSRYDLAGARCAVYRILPDGGSDLLWASTTVTAFSLYAHQNGSGVLIGTSDKGRLYSIGNDGRETLVLQSDADQISTIGFAGQDLGATSSNQGTLYRIGPDISVEGSYESPVFDAKATASWGRVWWRAEGNVSIRTRSGNTEKPDETWSSWSAPMTDPKGGQVSSPRARYLQWQAVLKPSAVPASLSEVSAAFAPQNIAPEVLSIQVLPTNIGLAANPAAPVDPNIELTGLDPSLFGVPTVSAPPRRVYQRGATSLLWTADDRNGDQLVYDLYFKEVGDATFKPLKIGIRENFYTIDGQALADGRYMFKITARDLPSNPPAAALSGERTTEPIDIDNTPPVVTPAGQPQINGNRARVSFDGADAASYLTRAEYSVNGGEWAPVFADDGISDSPRERYTFDAELPSAGEYAITLRVYDVNGNAGNARLVVRR